MITIPEHNCRNCGYCCGPFMVTKKELDTIKKYLTKNITAKHRTQLKKQKRDKLACQFRDLKNKNCAIYPVRPEVCRLFGIVNRLSCPYGNSASIPDAIVATTMDEEHFFLKEII